MSTRLNDAGFPQERLKAIESGPELQSRVPDWSDARAAVTLDDRLDKTQFSKRVGPGAKKGHRIVSHGYV